MGETAVTVSVGVSVGVSVVTGGAAGPGLVRNDLLDGLVRCGNEARQRSVAANPTQMVLGDDEARYWRGTLVGDAIIVGCCVAVFLGGAVLYALARGRRFVDVLMAARLPGRLTYVASLLAPPATTAVVTVAMYGSDDFRASAALAVTLGLVVVAVPAALQLAAVHHARKSLVLVEPRVLVDADASRAYAAPVADVAATAPGESGPLYVSDGGAEDDDELTPLGAWVAWCFAPIDGRDWPAAHPLMRTCGDVFDHLRFPLFLVLDVVGNVAVCALLGVFQSTNVPGHLCKPIAVTVAAVLLLQLGVAVAWQPFISRFYLCVYTTFNTVGALMATIAVMAQFELYEIESARSTVDVVNLVQGGVALAIACAAAFGAAYTHLGCGKRARASPVHDDSELQAIPAMSPVPTPDLEEAHCPSRRTSGAAVVTRQIVVASEAPPSPTRVDSGAIRSNA